MKLIEKPSPNYDSRDGRAVDMLIIHYTGMPSMAEALARMCDPASKVSAHYMIDEDGRIYRLVNESRRAWHAGLAQWAGETDINACSIGVELVNPGHEFGYRDFPLPQLAALISLCKDILDRHPIPAWRVLGHSDVAPMRKQDPGERFDWQRLARSGIGLWPGRIGASGRAILPGETGREVRALQKRLADFGYGLKASGQYDDETVGVVTALQRHFRPARVDGIADGETQAVLQRIREQKLGSRGRKQADLGHRADDPGAL